MLSCDTDLLKQAKSHIPLLLLYILNVALFCLFVCFSEVMFVAQNFLLNRNRELYGNNRYYEGLKIFHLAQNEVESALSTGLP